MAHYFTNEENLKSEIKKIETSINNINFYFYTDNGVFSKEGLDLGTKILLENLEISNYPQEKEVLDIGCGCGPIGIYLSKLGFKLDMSDVNKRAIHLANLSIKEQNLISNVFESEAYEKIGKKYDYIISNPPIKAGKNVLYDIVMNAKQHLKDNGELWIVVRKDKGALSLVKDMKQIYNDINIIKKKKGYFIIRAK